MPNLVTLSRTHGENERQEQRSEEKIFDSWDEKTLERDHNIDQFIKMRR
jgi:hypothetical protein